MLTQVRLALFGAVSIGCAFMVHPAALQARGGPSLFGQSAPSRESNREYRRLPTIENGGGVISSAAVFSFVPAAPPSLRWTDGRLKLGPSPSGEPAESTGGGYSIGREYWGVVNPLRYGGFTFWYASLDDRRYDNPYYGPTRHAYGQFDDGLFIRLDGNVPILTDVPYFAAARAQFYAGNYPESLRDVQHATIDMPASQSLQQFHALVLFALGEFENAAAVAHPVLNAGPGWDWTNLESFYSSVDVYSRQLRALEQFVVHHEDNAAAQFLLAYHYLMLGHLTAARDHLRQVVELEPRDSLAKNILAGLRDPWVPQSGDQQDHPATPESAGSLLGVWSSHPIADVVIEAMLDPAGHFVWNFKEGNQSRAFSGTYTLQGNRLIFTRLDGQMMDGIVVTNGGNRFWFRLKAHEASDPGLVFSR
jgi:tetratricopeptide (TPR) repeat protein